MRLRFNGLFASKKSGGCNCGSQVRSGKRFITHKTFVLPSGQTRTFSVSQEYDVNDLDGNFLLSYSQLDADGVIQNAFTRLD